MIRKYNEHIAYLDDDYDPEEVMELVGRPSGVYFTMKRKDHGKVQQMVNWSEQLQMYVYRDKDYTKIMFLLDKPSAPTSVEIDKNRIKDIMSSLKIRNYTIGKDDTISVHEDIELRFQNFTKFPIKILVVDGNMSVINSALESLENFPSRITGSLDVRFNRLKSLKYGPSVVKGNYDCSHNLLVSLYGVPSELKSFDCSHNRLTSLKHGPSYVHETYNCSNNQITNLIDSPVTVKTFNCEKNPIVNYKGMPKADFIIK
jgi:hypothetical protein